MFFKGKEKALNPLMYNLKRCLIFSKETQALLAQT